MTLKDFWAKAGTENGALTLDQFEALAKDNNVKFADVSDGHYVSVNKYNDDIKAKDTEITNLNETLKTRDTDLQSLQAQLGEAGTDAEKLQELSNNLTSLQSKYDTDTKELQNRLAKQGYEFAVREFAATKNFTSNAAKRDFINSMIDKGLKLSKDGKSIMGAEDFVNEYSADNADAFVATDNGTQLEETEPAPQNIPQFVAPSQGAEPPQDATGGFASAFHFTPIHPIPQE